MSPRRYIKPAAETYTTMRCRVHVTGVEGDPKYVVPRSLRAYADAIERGEADTTADYEAVIQARPPLPPGQQRVYDTLLRLYRETGRIPSSREIMRELGIKSTNGVRAHLLALHLKGYIEYTPWVSRGVKFL